MSLELAVILFSDEEVWKFSYPFKFEPLLLLVLLKFYPSILLYFKP